MYIKKRAANDKTNIMATINNAFLVESPFSLGILTILLSETKDVTKIYIK